MVVVIPWMGGVSSPILVMPAGPQIRQVARDRPVNNSAVCTRVEWNLCSITGSVYLCDAVVGPWFSGGVFVRHQGWLGRWNMTA